MFRWPGFDEGLDRGLEWAKKGTELDPESAIAHTRLAWVKVFFRELVEAIAIFEKALSLDPENAEVRAYYAETLNFSDDPEAAIKHLEIAFRLDPLAPPSWLFMLGHSNYLLERHDDAITLMRQAVERVPGLHLAQLLLACLYIETGQEDQAAEQVKIALEATPQYTVQEADRIYPYLDDSVRTRFLDGLRKAGLPE